MAKKDKYVVGLDIGSTKTCVLIAEIDDDQVKFLALGAAESKGLRKGLIVNLDAAVSSIRRAVEEAESVANIPVESAVIGVAGNHVRGVNSRGGISLGPRPRDIEREDVSKPSRPPAIFLFPKIAKSCTSSRMNFALTPRKGFVTPSA